MPIAQPILGLHGCVVNGGTLLLEKAVGLGSYGKVYYGVETDSAVQSRRSSWASSASASPSSSSSPPKPKVYAVKSLRRAQAFQDDPKLYEHERKLHSSVSDHPNIVTLHDTFIEQGHMFFVLDMHVHDTMLAAVLDGMYQHNTPLIKQTFAQLVDAILFCHRKGVYHRNIKPDHILVDYWGGNPCLTDFGMATSDVVSHQLGVGTAPYMAPESFDNGVGGSYRPELSDAWALGMTLMKVVTNNTPWFSARPEADKSFKLFVEGFRHDLCRRLPVSRPLSRLFRGFFRMDPSKRLSLERFNEGLQRMDDMFMRLDEVDEVVMSVRQQALWVGPGRTNPPPEGSAPPFPLWTGPPNESCLKAPVMVYLGRMVWFWRKW
ncbi:kinase-like domain-containing protein [Roridomyces roridus]|uniref:non-specific serine/threonine protein kinase n=1 Tax=Roridomyces roridus TaxID=1738132 RepID=A0AAD7CKS0_9AGAR|nr:kinase-like domain-containing protein [Roridomyces roridus]KAJ7650931.1 kinase-like domain-containing protein [Roridomyces roridus]